jgi:hypothetical protein
MTPNTRYALAGLQAGISGAIGLLLWMSLQARFFGKSLWWVPNLLATVFYRESSLKYSFGWYTLAGWAMVLFCYASLGVLFGLLWRDRAQGNKLLLAGWSVGIFAYFVVIGWGLPAWSPAAAMYAPNHQFLFAHLIFGTLLARYARFRERLFPDTVMTQEDTKAGLA